MSTDPITPQLRPAKPAEAVTGEHLHLHDHEASLELVSEVLRGHTVDGYRATDQGAWVDWVALERAELDEAERACLDLARAFARIETVGGLPEWLGDLAVDVISRIVSVPDTYAAEQHRELTDECWWLSLCDVLDRCGDGLSDDWGPSIEEAQEPSCVPQAIALLEAAGLFVRDVVADDGVAVTLYDAATGEDLTVMERLRVVADDRVVVVAIVVDEEGRISMRANDQAAPPWAARGFRR